MAGVKRGNGACEACGGPRPCARGLHTRGGWRPAVAALAAALLFSGCLPGMKLPLASPFKDGTATRWCAAVQKGASVFAGFSSDLDARAFRLEPGPIVPESRKPVAPQKVAESWASDYLEAKGVVEFIGQGLLAACQALDHGQEVTKEELMIPVQHTAEAFGDIVELHRDVMLQAPPPGQPLAGLSQSVRRYDHDLLLDELRIIQSEATAAIHRR